MEAMGLGMIPRLRIDTGARMFSGMCALFFV